MQIVPVMAERALHLVIGWGCVWRAGSDISQFLIALCSFHAVLITSPQSTSFNILHIHVNTLSL